MTLEFGLNMTGLGVLAMFSTIAILIIVCEVLKRLFKESEIKKTPSNSIVEKATFQREKISEEESAIITAAVITYLSGTPRISTHIITLKRGPQPLIWKMAGRIDLI